MVIEDALKQTFPVPAVALETIAVKRGIVLTDEFTQVVSVSQNYKLAEADVFMFIADSPDLKELESSVQLSDKVRATLRKRANYTYKEFNDSALKGRALGYKGERFN